MNSREIGELRRRARRDRSNMAEIYGCYVSGQGEILSEFTRSTAMMPENEGEKYFGLLKRTLSGTVGKNLIDVTFRTAQVADSPEHKLLMTLRDSKLKDKEARHALYGKIMENVSYESGFLILTGCDVYDVPFKSTDDESHGSGETYTYVLCAVCPVKLKKPELRYDAPSGEFHDGEALNIACAPETGFLFPAFDDRSSNIYNALFYTHSPKLSHEGLVRSLFCVEPPKPATEQKRSFENLLTGSLDRECSLNVMQTVHEQLCQTMEIHKESRVAEPLLISKEQVASALRSGGVSEKSVAKFSVEFDGTFGNEAQLHPGNLIDSRHFDINTPDVSIRVKPERSDLIETRMIGGVPYILICADDTVEVNGVPIHIEEKDG